MSMSIQIILGEARRLSSKLRDIDATADSVISEAHDMLFKITSMKEYQEEIAELNIMLHHRPHAALLSSIQQENRLLRELQAENRDLKATLEDYQSALEYIMSKYRQHVSLKLDQLNRTKSSPAPLDEAFSVNQAEKILKMANVMKQAAELDDKEMPEVIELLSRLSTENRTLRELLKLSTPATDQIKCEESVASTSQ
ncbi:FGFR1 oncogene partner 2 homolog [Artemia franciscana]|uniref:Uncharacterized protein n=1 Tax=Artemia franciscana TaxID=6661 RepID=A0AA88HGE6_ARTSF|nr:hypothetical protein QYM36_016563 [Artemia franciscana]